MVLGANGSGKSTLIQILSGAVLPSAGNLKWTYQGKSIDPDEIYRFVSIAAPYLDLIEDYSLRELLDFHFSLKPLIGQINKSELIELSTLQAAADRPLRYYSSGMKQRVKLLLALCSDTPLVLLDEPLSNLDARGSDWYELLIERFAGERIILVASNHQQREYSFCKRQIHLSARQ